MKKIEVTIIINRPVEEVFAAATDFERLPMWREGLIEAAVTSDGTAQKGSTYRFSIEAMGRAIETTGVVEAYEAPVKYAWRATKSPFPMKGTMQFEAVEGGTRLTESMEVDPGGFFKIAEPMLIKGQRRQMEKSLVQLKNLLETE